MRCYFHLTSERDIILDHHGIEMSVNEIGLIGRAFDELRLEEPELFEAVDVWSVEVVNEEGRRMAGFRLSNRP